VQEARDPLAMGSSPMDSFTALRATSRGNARPLESDRAFGGWTEVLGYSKVNDVVCQVLEPTACS
jgi:hypothetical protein